MSCATNYNATCHCYQRFPNLFFMFTMFILLYPTNSIINNKRCLNGNKNPQCTTVFRNMDLKGRNFQGSYFRESKSQKFSNFAELNIADHIAFLYVFLKNHKLFARKLIFLDVCEI